MINLARASGQSHPPTVIVGLILTIAAGIAITLGWFVFKGDPGSLTTRGRKDYIAIRRVVGGVFMLGGGAFLVAAVVAWAEVIYRGLS
ncbi:hypothetical protein [Streptacidiphilus monticola]|uniref:Transmembrane protein n=1 Tax=Streptacidiphilus monticola TaxID=2161674 RepID=A0ABW1GAP6_9ACTN